MPSADGVLATVPNVELARTGSWAISTGTWTPKREDLIAAVAALNCPAVRPPVIKLGHTDPRFDGQPAIGRVANLRVADGGHSLIGDLTGLPAWLPQVIAAAYPDRSVEGVYGFKCQLAHQHPFVLTGLALLGVTPPGVGTLRSIADVGELYGVAAAPDLNEEAVTVSATFPGRTPDEPAAAAGAESAKPGSDLKLREYWVHGEGAVKIRWGEGGDFDRCVTHLGKYVADPKGLCAEYHHEALGIWPATHAHLDKMGKGGSMTKANAAAGDTGEHTPDRAALIRSAYNRDAPYSRWIVEVADDEVIVIDDVDRSLHRIPVQVTGDDVAFGQSEPVRVAYVPDLEPVAASRMVFASRAESRPDVAAAAVSDKPWASFTQADYTPQQWRRACIVDRGDGDPSSKDRYALPVREPDGTLNRNGVHAAAARIGAVKGLTAEQRRAAAKTLAGLYRDELGEDPPPALTSAVSAAAEPPDQPDQPDEPPTTPPDPGGVPVSPAAEPEPTTEPEGDVMSLSADMCSRLGLDEGADEAAALAAIDALKTKADTPPAPTPEQVAAAAAGDAEKDELRKEVQVLASRMEAVTTELAAAKAEKAANVKASILGEAKKLGKFAPADEEQWSADYDEAPAAVTRILASIAPGTAVPVAARGVAGGDEVAADPDMPSTGEIDRWARQLGVTAEELTR